MARHPCWRIIGMIAADKDGCATQFVSSREVSGKIGPRKFCHDQIVRCAPRRHRYERFCPRAKAKIESPVAFFGSARERDLVIKRSPSEFEVDGSAFSVGGMNPESDELLHDFPAGDKPAVF